MTMSVAGVFKHVGAQTSFCEAAIEGLDLLARERGDFAEWIDAGDKTDLRLEDVADAGEHFLVEQHVGDLFVAVRLDAERGGFGGIEVGLRTSMVGWGNLRSRASDCAVCISATGTLKPTAM